MLSFIDEQWLLLSRATGGTIDSGVEMQSDAFKKQLLPFFLIIKGRSIHNEFPHD